MLWSSRSLLGHCLREFSPGEGGNCHGPLHAVGLDGGPRSSIRNLTDGTSNTILVGERTDSVNIYVGNAVDNPAGDLPKLQNCGEWGDFLNGENCIKGALKDGTDWDPSGSVDVSDGGPCAINCSSARGNFHSFHAGGATFVLGDGSARLISQNLDAFVLAGLITAAKGEVMGKF